MEDLTLFVIPPHACYLCPVHKGILQSPVTNLSCSHSFCEGCAEGLDACPVDHAPLQVTPNVKLQGDIDSLLCYCRFGVMKSSTGQLIPNPKGCSAIIKYSNRVAHEATCDFHDEKDFCFIDSSSSSLSPSPSPPSSSSSSPSSSPSLPIPRLSESLPSFLPTFTTTSTSMMMEESTTTMDMEAAARMVLVPCPHKDDGCFFLAESEDELSAHLSLECSYQRLRNAMLLKDQRIEQLQGELSAAHGEIALLREELENLKKPRSPPVVVVEPIVVDEAHVEEEDVAQKAKVIWEDILKLFGEEIPNGFNNARESVIRSAQKSSVTFSAIKNKISKKTESMKQELNDLHPLDKLIAVLSSIRDELLSSLKESLKKSPRMVESSPSSSSSSTTTTTEVKPPTNVDEEDPELKRQLEASMETYEAEKQARAQLEAFEAAAIAAASAQSLAEQAENTTSNGDEDMVLC